LSGTGSSLTSAGTSATSGGSGLNLGSALGAVAGALDGKDKEQTSSRDPWAPAQPLLKDLLSQAQTLSTQYQNQPFSDTQKQAYNNQFGLLNSAIGASPQVMQQMGLLGQGYDRNRANRTQTGYTAPGFDLSKLGLLSSNYGGK
jgi:hypothetical protein